MSIQCIMIASSKGGIGKSTVSLGIASALSRMGKRVLLCDLDFGSPCLDMLTGAEDSALYTVADVIKGRCNAAEAAVQPCGDKGINLYLLAAPSGINADTEAGFSDADSAANAIRTAAQALECDFVILDTGAGISFGSNVAAMAADQALIVAGHSPVSLRSAESTAQRIRDGGVEDIRLIINSFDSLGVRGSADRKGIFSIIDTSGLPLCGVVPYDYSLTLLHEKRGKCAGGGLSGIAFDNIARRLMQENVPLFSGMKKMRKSRDKFYK